MSDTKFTPGPWWAAIGKDQPVPYYRGLVSVLSSDPHISICTGETGDQSGRTCGRDEWEANASLIAAAPDLYEALEHALTITLEHHETTASQRSWNVAEMIRAALAKARGEK